MALINCPECGKQISDKAMSCPNCGFPIAVTSSHERASVDLVDVQFCGFKTKRMYSTNRFKAFFYVEKVLGRYYPEAEHVNRNEPYTIFKGVSVDAVSIVSKYLGSIGCIIESIPSKETTKSEFDSIILKSLDVTCPRCGSNQISTGERGFSLFTGFIGSNQTVNRCAKCGYSWKP